MSLARIAGARVGTLFIGFVCTALTLRLILSAHGSAALGAVSLLSTLIALIPFADLGLGTALVNMTVQEVSGHARGILRPAVRATMMILLGLGMAAIVVTTIVVRLLHPTSAVLAVLGDPDVFLPVYSAAIAAWLLSGPAFRVLYGMKRTATVILLQASASPLNVVATYVILQAGLPVWLCAVSPILMATVVSVPGWWIVLRSSVLSGSQPVTLPLIRRLLSEGLSGLLLLAGAAAMLQSDRLILASAGDALALAQFAVILPVYGAAQSLMSAAGAYLWPHYSTLRIDGSLNRAVVLRDTARCVGIALLMGIGLVAMMPGYLAVVGYHPVPWSPTVTLGLLTLLQGSGLVQSSLLCAPGLMRSQAWISLAGAAAKLAFAALLVFVLGVPNPALATCLAVGLVILPLLHLKSWRSVADEEAFGPAPTGGIAATG